MSTSQIEQLESASPTAAPERFWPLVREALAGSRRDLTAMPLPRAIVLLAIPMVLEMVMESIFAVADIFWVSKLGADAVAAVGLTESLLTIVYAIGMGMAMGVGAVVARRTGAKDPDGASRAAGQAIFIGFGLAVVLGLGGALAGPALLKALGASPAVMAVGSGYARVVLAGDVTVLLLFLINSPEGAVGWSSSARTCASSPRRCGPSSGSPRTASCRR
jgi:Na+-driven multidrug efflux pump